MEIFADNLQRDRQSATSMFCFIREVPATRSVAFSESGHIPFLPFDDEPFDHVGQSRSRVPSSWVQFSTSKFSGIKLLCPWGVDRDPTTTCGLLAGYSERHFHPRVLQQGEDGSRECLTRCFRVRSTRNIRRVRGKLHVGKT